MRLSMKPPKRHDQNGYAADLLGDRLLEHPHTGTPR